VRAVRGSVRYCDFENTKVPPANWLFGGDYISAIDMMALESWTFSDNVFKNIKGRNGGGRAAIFVWCDPRISWWNEISSSIATAGWRLEIRVNLQP
jgi:hypothetical protein